MSAASTIRSIRIFLVSILAVFSHGVSLATERVHLVVWHPFVGEQEKLFSNWLREFGLREHLTIRTENGFDINTALRKKALTREYPDVVVGPSALLKVSDSMPLQPLSKQEFSKRNYILERENPIAIRLFENGGHFLLRKRGLKAPSSRTELFFQLKNGKSLFWSNVEPLFFLSSVLSEDKSVDGIGRALRSFRELMLAANTPFPCDHRCLWTSIIEKKADFAIVGDWQFSDLNKANAGKDYVLEPLPLFLGKCVSLPYIAFFPTRAESNENRERASRKLVLWLSSSKIQRQVQLRFLQRPAGMRIDASLWPSWMRSAVGSSHECSDVSHIATPEFWAISSAAVRQMSIPTVPIEEIVSKFARELFSSHAESLRVVK